MRRTDSLSLVLLAALAPLWGFPSAPAATAAAPQQPAGRCAAHEFRQFDFWIGDWEVRNPQGQVVGHDQVRRIAGGCGLLESWRAVRGGEGTSLNTWDADLGRWTQRWVGAGATLWLLGGLHDGAMVLSGAAPRATPRGKVFDRITWRPLTDGRVRQIWEVSSDGGAHWTTSFVGLYARVPRRP